MNIEAQPCSLLIGDRHERIEMLLAGRDELPPRYPIFVRPAARQDPHRPLIADFFAEMYDGFSDGIEDGLRSRFVRVVIPATFFACGALGLIAWVLLQAWSYIQYGV